MRKRRSYVIAPAAVFIIMMSVFFIYSMFPFGNKTLSWCDMNQQVIPFLMDFKDILSGKANIFLNMQNSGGMNFWGVFLFFISSPFTFLVAFVNKADMYLFVNLFVTLKMMICALTASIFFNHQFKKLNLPQNIAISVMYAFCGYAMLYYQNQVWLDVMYLFPILLIGLAKLIDKDKVLLYILSFTAILTVNFYLSYMVSIFLVLSFGIYIFGFSPRQRRRKSIVLLGLSTLIVALMTAVVWLPSLIQYVDSARTGNLIQSLKSGGLFTRFDTTVAVIICTGAIFAAFLIYILFTVKSSAKGTFAVFIFLLTVIPVLIEPINKMWQTGNYQAFPVRYGYITVFFGLIILAVVITQINEEHSLAASNSFALFGGMMAVGAVFVAECLLLYKDYDTITVYTKTLWGNKASFQLLFAFSLIVTLAYLIILLLYKFRQLAKTAFSVFLCAIVLLECLFNTCVYIASVANDPQNEAAVIDLSGKIQDDTLFRVKTNQKYYDVNLTGSLGYNTLSHYTSLTGENFMFTMKKLGYSSYWMEVNSNGGTQLTDAILGNKYCIISNSEVKSTDKIIYQNNNYTIIQNRLSLPMGLIMQSGQISSIKNLPESTRLNLQQNLFQSVFSTDKSLFVNYEPTSLNNVSYTEDEYYSLSIPDTTTNGFINYKVPVKEKQTLYFDCFDRLTNSLIEHINSSFNVFVNGKLIQSDYPNQSSNGLINLGTFTNETVNVQVEVLKDVNAKSFGLSGLKEDVLEKAIAGTSTANLKQINNKIVGTAITNITDSYLFLPLTYDKGYSAQVNHKKAEVICVFDSMMAVKLEKGSNEITISYVPSGFQTGICLSIVGLMLFLAFLLFLKKGCYHKIDFFEFPATIVFSVLCIGVFIAVYIFPLFVYFNK